MPWGPEGPCLARPTLSAGCQGVGVRRGRLWLTSDSRVPPTSPKRGVLAPQHQVTTRDEKEAPIYSLPPEGEGQAPGLDKAAPRKSRGALPRQGPCRATGILGTLASLGTGPGLPVFVNGGRMGPFINI